MKFTMDEKTILEDLLKLELHKFEEEVKNTVDKATKEMSMEKVLKELNNTWNVLEFGKETHERTRLSVLNISEETIEMLEENQVCISFGFKKNDSEQRLKRLFSQVQLQSMLDSKYIAYFLDEVIDWRQKLNNADATINAWFRVQRAWMYLESIFMESEDIRSQLPEESKRFEKIDKDFKVILRNLTNIILRIFCSKEIVFEINNFEQFSVFFLTLIIFIIS